MKSINKD